MATVWFNFNDQKILFNIQLYRLLFMPNFENIEKWKKVSTIILHVFYLSTKYTITIDSNRGINTTLHSQNAVR